MLLRHQFPDAPNPDEREIKRFSELRSDSAGLPLALQCCSVRYWLSCNVLWIGGKPLWSWWSRTIKNVKNPADNVTNMIALAKHWRSDQQFRDLVSCLLDHNEFRRIEDYCSQFCTSSHAFASEMWHYVIGLLSHRVISMTKHELPPYAYSAVLSEVSEDERSTWEFMRHDWAHICIVEQASLEAARRLSEDLQSSIYAPMRLCYLCVEQGSRASLDQAKKIMRFFIEALPDTKIIEDCHQRVRCDSLMNANRRQSVSEVQSVVMNSKTLEERKIRHPCALNRKVFLSKFKTTSGKTARCKHYSGNEKLSERFGRILGQKKWPTLSADTLSRSAGAFIWVRHYMLARLASSSVALDVPWSESNHQSSFVLMLLGLIY